MNTNKIKWLGAFIYTVAVLIMAIVIYILGRNFLVVADALYRVWGVDVLATGREFWERVVASLFWMPILFRGLMELIYPLLGEEELEK